MEKNGRGGGSGWSTSQGLYFAHYFRNNRRVAWNHFQVHPAPGGCTQTCALEFKSFECFSASIIHQKILNGPHPCSPVLPDTSATTRFPHNYTLYLLGQIDMLLIFTVGICCIIYVWVCMCVCVHTSMSHDSLENILCAITQGHCWAS